MAETSTTLAQLYAAGRIIEANKCMCQLMQQHVDVQRDLCANVRTQFRIIEELTPTGGADEGVPSGFSSHPVVNTSFLDVYDNMSMCYSHGIEKTVARVSFQTEYDCADLRDVLWACAALPLVFADELMDAVLLCDETPNTRVVLLTLAGTVATSLRQRQAVVRVTRVNGSQHLGANACPMLVLHDASGDAGFAKHLDRTQYYLEQGFAACIFMDGGIEEHTVSVCVRWAPVRDWVHTMCALPLSFFSRLRMLRAVQTWLAVVSKVYHGDRTVGTISRHVSSSKRDDVDSFEI